MITVGQRVRVKDNYAGGLDNVVGHTGKVARTSTESLYLLDFQGQRPSPSGNYTFDYDVIVKNDEIETVDFDITDSKGQKIEIGDTLVYGPSGGGITRGVVVDIDERGEGWNKAVKFRLEIEGFSYHSDGGDRDFNGGPLNTYRWYENSRRALIISKGITTFTESDVLRSVPNSW